MRYFFVFAAIAAIWLAVIIMAVSIHSGNTFTLYFVAQILTVALFFIGYYRK